MFFERGTEVENKRDCFIESDCSNVSRTGVGESVERCVPSVREQRKVYECCIGGEYHDPLSYCRGEMFGIDQNQSYGLAFAYIETTRDVTKKCLGAKTKRCSSQRIAGDT